MAMTSGRISEPFRMIRFRASMHLFPFGFRAHLERSQDRCP